MNASGQCRRYPAWLSLARRAVHRSTRQGRVLNATAFAGAARANRPKGSTEHTPSYEALKVQAARSLDQLKMNLRLPEPRTDDHLRRLLMGAIEGLDTPAGFDRWLKSVVQVLSLPKDEVKDLAHAWTKDMLERLKTYPRAEIDVQ